MLNNINNENDILPNLFDNLCNLYYIDNENPFQNELNLYRKLKPKESNITKYIKKGKIRIFNMKKIDNNYSSEKIKEKIIELFKYILIVFFNIIIRSKERKYFGCYVDLIKFLINRYEYCANYFLEEFSCYNTIIEYLINCPLYEIKKVIVGIIYFAMIKSNLEYLSKNHKKIHNNKYINSFEILKENSKLKKILEKKKSLEKAFEERRKSIEIKKIYEKKENNEIDVNYLNEVDNRDIKGTHEKKIILNGEEELNENIINNEPLENENISPNNLKLIYNILYILKKNMNSKNKTLFLYETLLKFSLISAETKLFLNKNIKLSLLLNLMLFKDCTKNAYNDKISNIDKYLFNTSHEILNENNGYIIYENEQNENENNIDKYHNLNYDFMLLCSLMFNKERTKEKIEENHEDIGFTFWNIDYILKLIWHSKTKQNINYLSYLIKIKCINNREIFDNVLKALEYLLDNVNDCEDSFYDEYDEEQYYNIYNNTNNKESNLNNLILLRSNVTIIIRKLIIETVDLDNYRLESILNKLFSLFNKYKRYYSLTILIVNIITDIFEERKIYKNYIKKLNEVIDWLNKFKIPPKFYEIKGIKMYKDEELNYQKNLDLNIKKEFEQRETEKTNKKIERLNKIMKEKNINNIDIYYYNYDLSDFNFKIGDQVIYDNNIYKITHVLDELIKIKLIKNNNLEEKNIFCQEINVDKKIMNIDEKEEKSFWVETDDYKLKIRKLID